MTHSSWWGPLVLVAAAVLGTTANAAPPSSTIFLSFDSDNAEYQPGESGLLSWATLGAKFCRASGAWKGKLAPEGTYRTKALDRTTSFTIKCWPSTKRGQSVEQTLTLTVSASDTTPPEPMPTLAFSVTDSNVVSGKATTLNWSATDVTGCTASDGWSGARAASGSEEVGPLSANATYRLTCDGPGGTVSDTLSVSVEAPAAPPTMTFSASPTTLTQGDNAVLSWSSTDATGCSASGDWSGAKSASGSETLTPSASSTFTLTCSGDSGSVSQTAAVAVEAPAAPPTMTFSASPTTLTQGDNAVLSWSSTDATGCSASGDWSGAKTASGSETLTPSASSTFTLTCSGDGGSVSESATVTVNTPAVPTLTMNLSSSTVNEGDSVTVSWTATDADECSATGAWTGPRETSGNETSAPLMENATFGMSCTGPSGHVSDSHVVTVTAPAEPETTMSASPDWVGHRESTTLSWTATNVDECTASGAWSGTKNPTGGSETVGPITADSTFTLDCVGPGGNTVSAVSVGVRTARLSWDAPTHNVDGSALDDLAGFTVHYGPVSRSYTATIPINDPATREVLIDLNPGTYFFAVTARNDAGNESAFSGEVSKTVQ